MLLNSGLGTIAPGTDNCWSAACIPAGLPLASLMIPAAPWRPCARSAKHSGARVAGDVARGHELMDKARAILGSAGIELVLALL